MKALYYICRGLFYVACAVGFILAIFGLSGVYEAEGWRGIRDFFSPFNFRGLISLAITFAPALLLNFLSEQIKKQIPRNSCD